MCTVYKGCRGSHGAGAEEGLCFSCGRTHFLIAHLHKRSAPTLGQPGAAGPPEALAKRNCPPHFVRGSGIRVPWRNLKPTHGVPPL